ncbi:MAG: DNA translocase FtsK [Rhodobacteraceae bacterium]|nr:DNA translocase FtsK [Paracoccaceae bacterium]
MAYQTRTRDPLLDTKMQEAIQKRGAELVGFGLFALAALVAALLWSYSPEDPSWLNATSEPARNLLGGIGAAIASRLILTIGWASWCFPVLFVGWGVRFIFHLGDDRLFSRAIAIPIFVAVSAVFLACHVPMAGWQHLFGLGGMSGDAALGILLDLVPLTTGYSLTAITLVLGIFFLIFGLFSLGFTRSELATVNRHSLVAVILTYASIFNFLGFFIRNGARGLLAAKSKYTSRKEEKQAKAAAKLEALSEVEIIETEELEYVVEEQIEDAEPPAKKPLFTMPRLLRSTNTVPVARAEEDSNETSFDPQALADLPEEDRVRARINDAIKSKVLRARNLRVGPQNSEPVVRDNIFHEETDTSGNAAPKLGGASRSANPDAGNEESLESPEAASFTSVRAKAEPTSSADLRKVVKRKARRAARQSAKAKAEAQPSLFKENKKQAFETPPLSLLANPATIVRHHLSDEALGENARMLESVLDDYGVKGDIVSVRPGPVVTMYELEPAPGLKASRVIGLADDIARSMSALSARVSTVPGRTVIGIELPNENRETVLLREILSARDYGDGQQALPLALGKDIGGTPVVANLAKMPHLLIAGTTGSGKSVAINTMILSLLYRLSPEQCRMIMIDPKMLELSVYDGIPHLLSPVVTDPKKAVVALKWVVGEMEERYRKMSKMGVRNIGGYNARVKAALEKGEDFERTVQTGFDDETGDPVFETETFKPEKMPFIVVIVDEMADLMMVAGKEIEACIQRLAQMARASGIHLIMATQRPSVDVITGTIKANFPTRISFQVTSKVDSRTILGEMGAEQLLGMGDMLFMAGGGKITRIHAPFASDEEVEEVVNALKAYGPPEYVNDVASGPSEEMGSDIDQVLGLGGNTNGEDALYDQAVAIVVRDRKCSTSYIQRKLSIGYNKAAKLVEQMEEQNVVSQANHVGKREILVPEQ